MKKTRVNTTYRTINAYMVEGITTETNAEIIDFCDPCNWGGQVFRKGDGKAYVEVDID
jgi:hypothetical protein